MNDRERAHVLLDEFSDAELEEIVIFLRVRRDEVEPEMAELPEAWKTATGERPRPTGSQASTRLGEIFKAGPQWYRMMGRDVPLIFRKGTGTQPHGSARP